MGAPPPDWEPSHADDDRMVAVRLALRASVLGMARQLSHEEREAASRRACELLVDLRALRLAETVVLYHAVDHELDPTPAIEALTARGTRVGLTQVLDGRMVLVHDHDPGLLVAGPDGSAHPAGGTIPVDQVGAIVLPGVAFDFNGGRLGRGGGHYNRLLASLPQDTVRIGLAHSLQLVTRVPRSDDDEALDIIVSNWAVHHTNARITLRDA